MTKIYIGIDYSYTSPSVCILGKDFLSSKFFFMNGTKKVCVSNLNYEGVHFDKKNFKRDIDRFDHVSDWAIDKIANYYKPNQTEIYMEGYSYGSSVGKVFNIAENAGLLKYKIYRNWGLAPELLAPTSVKKFFTGIGNCGKDGMVFALQKNEGVNIMAHLKMTGTKIASPAHDIVDSYAVAKMGYEMGHGYKL